MKAFKRLKLKQFDDIELKFDYSSTIKIQKSSMDTANVSQQLNLEKSTLIFSDKIFYGKDLLDRFQKSFKVSIPCRYILAM